MSGDAEAMNRELLDLVRGKVPETSFWKEEVPSDNSLRGSKNKPLTCKAAASYYSYRVGRTEEAIRHLEWWIEYVKLPFMQGEELTPEEVYRPMFIYPPYAAAALARRLGRTDIERACLGVVRAGVVWLGMGTGTGPGKMVTNHHLDNVTAPCILVGDGEFPSKLPYVAQAGMRGHIRNRDGGPQTFHFTESIGLSAIVGQAANLSVPRKLTPWQCDLFAAIGDIAPGIDVLGFSPNQRVQFLGMLNNPTNLGLVVEVVKWIAAYGPSLDFEFIRYVDGSVFVYMLKNHSSSTDDRMIDGWLLGGSTLKASADDGLRSSHLSMECQETSNEIACSGSGRSVAIAKPRIAESHRISVRNKVVQLHAVGVSIDPPVVPGTNNTGSGNHVPSSKENKWNTF